MNPRMLDQVMSLKTGSALTQQPRVLLSDSGCEDYLVNHLDTVAEGRCPGQDVVVEENGVEAKAEDDVMVGVEALLQKQAGGD
nr:hypothetical protein BaRGS_011267 [Batillaria attramentaria]